MININTRIQTKRLFNHASNILSKIISRSASSAYALLYLFCLALLSKPLDSTFFNWLLFAFFWLIILRGLYNVIKHSNLPKLSDSDRHLEQTNNALDRPITLHHDFLANESDERQKIWLNFQRDMKTKILGFRLPKYFYNDAEKDPYGLRIIPVFVLIILISLNGTSTSLTTLHTLPVPPLYTAENDKSASLPYARLEFIPPAYTQLSTKIIEGYGPVEQVIDIAESSVLKITINKRFLTPKLFINDVEAELSNAEENSKTYVHEVNIGETQDITDALHQISIKAGPFTSFQLSYKLINDEAPILSSEQPFTVQSDGTLKFKLSVQDDYGIENLNIFMDLPIDFEGEQLLGAPYNEQRLFKYGAGLNENINMALNLTRHTYAGYDAVINLSVTDAAGQLSNTETIKLILPERSFNEEISKRLIALRKFIITKQLDHKDLIYSSLYRLSRSAEILNADPVSILALSVARERLLNAANIDTLYALVDILWRVALHLDKGNFLQAQQDLQAAINDLNQLLQDEKSSQADRLKALQKLQQALANYFMEAQKDAINRMDQDDLNTLPRPQTVSPNTDLLRDFFSQLEDMALNDSKKARDMLQDLEQALNSLNNSMQAELPQDIQQMMEVMQELQSIIDQQKALLDKSRLHQDYLTHLEQSERRLNNKGAFTQNTEQNVDLESFFKQFNLPSPDIHNNEGQKSSDDFNQNVSPVMDVIIESGTQRHIQDQLQDMTKNMPITPDEFKNADKHMGNSATFLQHERLKKSIGEQEKVLDALNQKKDQLQQSFQQRIEQFAKENNIRLTFDPLGRPTNPNNSLSQSLNAQEYDLPKGGQERQLDRILKELRARSGDYERPKTERDYYKRLLQQW